MKVYNRADFLTLPEGVIFCSGPQWAFGNLRVKGESLLRSNDFVCLELQWIDSRDSGEAVDRLDAMLQAGASYPMNGDYGRDGCFADEEVFLVWERADLERLMQYCERAIEATAGRPVAGA